MQAIVYEVNPVGWATCKWLRHFWPGCLFSRLAGLSLRQIEPPSLPADDWVRVRTLLAGICGTDLSLLAQKQPPNSLLQAFSSMPMVLGHEALGEVVEVGPAVDRAWLGRRVCVDPTLACEARGIDPPCPRCREGLYGACQNFGASGLGRSKLPPGTCIGYNSRTGGAFAENFVAHVSQLAAVPEGVPDELAVLTDPLACSLHAVLRLDLSRVRDILIYGAGVLGLGVVAALRTVGYADRIDALDLCEYLGELASALGADEMLHLPPENRARFEIVARRTGGTVQRARFGNYMLSGGYDAVIDCVGSRRSITESLKWTASRGQMVMLATGHGRGADLTPIWFTELTVLGTYGRQIENWRGRRIGTYQLVHELMAAGKLNVSAMLTHKFPLSQYRRAMETGANKSAHKAVKVAFDMRG
jgi:threonine dehydrogenase-like Zn-dependent dehydrogenase